MKIIALNIMHLCGVIFPLAINFYSPARSDLLWLFLVFLIGVPLATAFFASRYASCNGLLSREIAIGKDLGLRQMGEICFSPFWLIPNKNLLLVSDGAWISSQKRYNATVRAALHSSADVLYFVLGGAGVFAAYAAYLGEFGVVFSKLLGYSSGGWVFWVILMIAPWMATICLFNYFFRIFVWDKK